MTGFDSRTSGVGSDRSTNWATTTAQISTVFVDPETTKLWITQAASSKFQTGTLYMQCQVSVKQE